MPILTKYRLTPHPSLRLRIRIVYHRCPFRWMDTPSPVLPAHFSFFVQPLYRILHTSVLFSIQSNGVDSIHVSSERSTVIDFMIIFSRAALFHFIPPDCEWTFSLLSFLFISSGNQLLAMCCFHTLGCCQSFNQLLVFLLHPISCKYIIRSVPVLPTCTLHDL
ncbi:hypothetical protein K474DRAFT_1218002 [Panus rudis PR-1116 ss-1]|nr:hypothetical protein K474DRAFT_1218002 [Panus rudis PR-1116 ss-1]